MCVWTPESESRVLAAWLDAPRQPLLSLSGCLLRYKVGLSAVLTAALATGTAQVAA